MKPTTTPSSAEPVNAQDDAPAPATQDAHPVSVLPSADLLRGQKAVAIDHNGSLYRLQTTRQGKLILTK
ncbi:hemin uptake protein HemP [Hydrogenophaga sp.]|jgi:hemin uptake protein HemP|uniref:hemin uptake protein HemP n=1 Tax=Hydrogenophaga sp. TaxID=1904254 RepID=UPI003F71958A